MICIFGLSFVCIALSDNKEDTHDWKYARLGIYGCNRKPGLDFGHGSGQYLLTVHHHSKNLDFKVKSHSGQ